MTKIVTGTSRLKSIIRGAEKQSERFELLTRSIALSSFASALGLIHRKVKPANRGKYRD